MSPVKDVFLLKKDKIFTVKSIKKNRNEVKLLNYP